MCIRDRYTPDAGAAAASSGSSAQTANRAEAKERSQNHTASASASTQSSGVRSKYGDGTNWDKVAKNGVSDEVKNDPRLQEMVKDPHDGKMKNKYAIMYNSGNIVENPAVHDLAAVERQQKIQAGRDAERAAEDAKYEARQAYRDENGAYRQSRIDIQTAAPKSLVNNQSARDKHQGNLDKGNPMVTGPASQDDPIMIAKNEMAQQLYDTGYDYSYNEMIRHQNDGAEDKTMSGLYDTNPVSYTHLRAHRPY